MTRRTACALIGALVAVVLSGAPWARLVSADAAEAESTSETRIDLPTVLRLAGAQNLDIQIARLRLEEARADHHAVAEEFFPWLSAGFSYRGHDGLTQATTGEIVDVHKYSYSPGVIVAERVDVGNALFRSRETRKLVVAANRAVEARNAEILFFAVRDYFDLARAQAALAVAEEGVRISRDYEQQLHHGVEIGLVFKGDELRVRTQVERGELARRQALADQRISAARLAEILHLDPQVALVSQDAELVPLSIVDASASLESLVVTAMASRPEIKEANTRVVASEDAKDGAVMGPLIPSVEAAVLLGGLGGGKRDVPSQFGGSADYVLTLSWRIGPGGLFDGGRIQGTRARLGAARFEAEKTRLLVVREVVEALTRVRSLGDQIATAREGLSAAKETLRLSQERKEFGIANVLEYILAAQDLTRARTDYLESVAEYDKAQYALARAIGSLVSP